MVAEKVRKESSDMLLTGKVLQYAVHPEAALGANHYLSSLTTISDVEVSADLQVIVILDRIKNEKRIAKSDDQHGPSDSPQDEREWEEGDPDDEGIIYIK